MQNGKTALFRCVRFVSMCFDIPSTTCRGFSMIFLGRCKASQLPNPWSGLLFETQLPNCLTNGRHAKPSKRNKIRDSFAKFTKRYVDTGCRCLNAPNVPQYAVGGHFASVSCVFTIYFFRGRFFPGPFRRRRSFCEGARFFCNPKC